MNEPTSEYPPLYPSSVDPNNGPPRWPTPEPPRDPFRAIFIGPNGLRAGWALLLFGVVWVVTAIYLAILGQVWNHTNVKSAHDLLRLEFVGFHAMIGAGVVVGWVSGRRAKDYFLVGPRPIVNFAKGMAVGAGAMIVIALLLSVGGWLRVSAPPISASVSIRYGLLWAFVFLTVAGSEEGMFRSFFLSTLSRGMNFWASLIIAVSICFGAALSHQKAATGAALTLAIIGLVPAMTAKFRRSPNEGFWSAVWLTSTVFGLIHAMNPGETYLGIVDAGIAGYAFCLGIKVTGTLWWSIGCHAAWDWMQTYFLGTPDSGIIADGHLLTTSPVGPSLLSGGATGPEGSLIGVAVDAAIIVALLVSYRRAQIRLSTSATKPSFPVS